jgi:hypothetical protein
LLLLLILAVVFKDRVSYLQRWETRADLSSPVADILCKQALQGQETFECKEFYAQPVEICAAK